MYSTHNVFQQICCYWDLWEPTKSKYTNIWLEYQKHVYIDKLDDISDKYYNTYHITIKMKPDDVISTTYIDIGIENNDPKFKVRDHVEISKQKNTFAKTYIPDWSEKVCLIKKVKNTVPWTCFIGDLNGEEIVGTFYQKELQKKKLNIVSSWKSNQDEMSTERLWYFF